MDNNTRIPFEELKHGGVYRISSRNLNIGVYNENCKGYIGIREKFYSYYLFTEFDWDTGPPFGTVNPKEFLGMLPPEIPVAEYIEGVITEQNVGCFFNKKLGEPCSVENKALFDWLNNTYYEGQMKGK